MHFTRVVLIISGVDTYTHMHSHNTHTKNSFNFKIAGMYQPAYYKITSISGSYSGHAGWWQIMIYLQTYKIYKL